MLSERSKVLSKCVAVTFSPNERYAASTNALVEELGFGAAVDFRQINEVPADKLIYIFVHCQVPDEAKLRILKALRSSENLFRRYAPVVCLVSSGPRHQAAQLVELGFDEVLFLADSTEAMAAKLTEQLGREHIYVETQRYFGPDRRRIEIFNPQDPRRKIGPEHCRKIRVLRDPKGGISVRDVG